MLSKILNLNTISCADDLIVHGVKSIKLRYSTRSRRSHLKVQRNGTIEVVLPVKTTLKYAIDFIEQNHLWLVSSLKKIDAINYQDSTPPAIIQLDAIGVHTHVDYHHDCKRSKFHLKHDRELTLFMTDPHQWKPLLHRWLAKMAKQHLIPWLHQISVECELPFNRVSVRGQKGRWGSCSSASNININYKLLFLQPELVEYLFIHELCHTIHPNHSHKFWSLVAYHLPDYQKSDRLLRQSMATIPHWATE